MALGIANPNKKTGQCEVCDRDTYSVTNEQGETKNHPLPISLHYGNMWFCDECWTKEENATKANSSPEAQQTRVDNVNARYTTPLSNAISQAQQIDSTIQVRTDLFNAATTAIMDLKKSIDEDPTVENKPFALASTLKTRFEHFKQVVFELNEKIVEAGNQQKAIQIYLNQLANQLRAEEREKLKIADISYKPLAPKSPKKVTTTQTSKKTKIDKTELRKYAAELGISEFTLQMVVVQKGITVAEAAKLLKASIEASK